MTDPLRKAAEMALEALEIWEKMQPNTTACAARIPAIQALRQALAQPEQEPLVWMNKYGHVASFQNEEYKDPLYTAPPKREWVGLTDEEVNELVARFKRYSYVLLREVELKLKEKNGG